MDDPLSDIAHLGKFWGYDIPPELLDGLLAYSLKPADIEHGRSLYARKWWDYKFIHPGHSFLLFSHLYAKALRKWRTKFGVSLYAKIKRAEHPVWRVQRGYTELAPPAHRTGLWRATCFADEYGIPYPKFIDWALESAFENKWERLPSPSMLYGVQTLEFITTRWEEDKNELLTMPSDPRFLAESYAGHPFQDTFHDNLCKSIKRRAAPVITLSHYLVKEPLVDRDRALKHFSQAQIDAAIARFA